MQCDANICIQTECETFQLCFSNMLVVLLKLSYRCVHKRHILKCLEFSSFCHFNGHIIENTDNVVYCVCSCARCLLDACSITHYFPKWCKIRRNGFVCRLFNFESSENCEIFLENYRNR